MKSFRDSINPLFLLSFFLLLSLGALANDWKKAAQNGDIPELDRLLALNSVSSSAIEAGPGMWRDAAGNGRVNVLNWLREHAIPGETSVNPEGLNVWLLAAALNQVNVLEWLRKNRIAGQDATTQHGDNVWELAAFRGNIDVLQWLFDNEIPLTGQNLWRIAASHQQTKVLSWLLSNKIPGINSVGSRGENLWVYAAMEELIDVLDWMKQSGLSGIDLVYGEQKWTLWTFAAALGKVKVLQWLTDNDAPGRDYNNVYACNMWHLAAVNNRINVLDWLFQNEIPGSDVLNSDGLNLWMCATGEKAVEVVKWLRHHRLSSYDLVLRHGCKFALETGMELSARKSLNRALPLIMRIMRREIIVTGILRTLDSRGNERSYSDMPGFLDENLGHLLSITALDPTSVNWFLPHIRALIEQARIGNLPIGKRDLISKSESSWTREITSEETRELLYFIAAILKYSAILDNFKKTEPGDNPDSLRVSYEPSSKTAFGNEEELSGELDGVSYQFKSHDVPSDGDCGFNVLGIGRDQAIEQLNANLADPRIREMVVTEMLNDRLERGAFDFETREQLEAAREALRNNPDALRTFIRHMFNDQNWLTYVLGGQLGLMDALAEINGIEIFIWADDVNPGRLRMVHHYRPQIQQYGLELVRNTIHVRHTRRGTHFELLEMAARAGVVMTNVQQAVITAAMASMIVGFNSMKK